MLEVNDFSGLIVVVKLPGGAIDFGADFDTFEGRKLAVDEFSGWSS